MLRFLFYRLLQSLAVLWAVYTLTFFLLMLAPGDPFISGEKRPPESVRKALAQKYGLDYLATDTPLQRPLPPASVSITRAPPTCTTSAAPAPATSAPASNTRIFPSSTSSAPRSRSPSLWYQHRALGSRSGWSVAAGTRRSHHQKPLARPGPFLPHPAGREPADFRHRVAIDYGLRRRDSAFFQRRLGRAMVAVAEAVGRPIATRFSPALAASSSRFHLGRFSSSPTSPASPAPARSMSSPSISSAPPAPRACPNIASSPATSAPTPPSRS